MIKRNIYIIGLLVFLLTGITSCTKWLDLKPESEIILDDYWQSESDVESVLSACYRGLTEDAVISRMIVWGELRSDNLIVGNGFHKDREDMLKILEGDLISTNAYSSWASFYSVINYCNTLLYYAPKVVNRDVNFTTSDLQRVQAEALTLRALSYFYLVRAYKEVPYLEEASVTDIQDYSLPKVSEDTIIKYIISDLLTARKYARSDFGVKALNKGRITLNAVNTLLADVYLWNGDYNECVAACDLVLADKKIKLEESSLTYTRVYYLGNSTESIFELQFNENIQKNNTVNSLYGTSGKPFGEVSFPTTLAYNQLANATGAYSPFNFKISTTVTESAKDIRAKDSYVLNGGNYYVFKYAGLNRIESTTGPTTGSSSYYYRSNTSNWIIYRLSDLMLMKAEALVQLSSESDMKAALSLVNSTYLRSNAGQDSLLIVNYSTKAEMEKLVLRERQRELLFEGKRWFDLVRMARRENSTSTLNDFVNHKSPGNGISLGAPVMDAMYMPISRSELEANPNLKQNTYYEDISSSSTR